VVRLLAGRVATARGAADEAGREARAAAEVLGAAAIPWWRAQALRLLATVTGDDDAARTARELEGRLGVSR
jgi:hypothetical protein